MTERSIISSVRGSSVVHQRCSLPHIKDLGHPWVDEDANRDDINDDEKDDDGEHVDREVMMSSRMKSSYGHGSYRNNHVNNRFKERFKVAGHR